MSNSDPIFLRLTGTFAWPPFSPGPTATLEAKGAVEIRYRIDGDKPRAYVCWIPEGHAAQVTPSEDSAAYTAAALKAQEHETPFCLWTDKLPKEFEFRGGQVFGWDWPQDNADKPPSTVVPLRSDPPGRIATASRLRFDKADLIAELALPRFGERDDNDGTALLARVKVPHIGTNRTADASILASIPETQRDSPNTFVRGQASEVLKAISVTPTAISAIGMTVGATIKGHGIVYRFSDVPAGFFPRLDQTQGLICSKQHDSDVHAVIAHTSSRELWIDAGNQPLTLEARVTWQGLDAALQPSAPGLADPQLPKSLKPDISLALTWPGTSTLASPFALVFPCVTLWQVLQTAIEDAGKGIESLKTVSGGQPQTFLPKMTCDGGQSLPWFAAYPRDTVEAEQQLGEEITINPENRDRAMRFTIAEGVPGIEGTIAWPGFDTPGNSTGAGITLLHAETVDPADDPFRDSSEWMARFDVVVRVEIPKTSGRLGSLRFEREKQRPPKPEDRETPKGRFGHLLIRTPRTMPATVRQGNGPLVFRPQSEFGFTFPLSAVHPVATDIPWGDREIEATPLLVPLSTDSSASAAFLLEVTETIGPDTDRQLTAKILENSTEAAETGDGLTNPSPKTVSYALVATEPFGVVRFSRQPLATSGDAENAIVAAFDSDTRTWLFKKVSEEYRYDFPPQGIGEGSDKPGRWELHDLANDGPGKGDIISEGPPGSKNHAAVVRPAPEGPAAKSYVVDCRFSPSTTLWIRPSDLERNYFLPEWAAHEIFRQHNDFGIGAALSALRGEFLYGLAVGISTRKESGPSRAARVAEVEALTGRLPAVKYTDLPDQALSHRWGSLRRALKTRHERLEVWTPAPGEPRPFGAARFQSGVTYALRLETASMRPPVLPPPAAPDPGSEKLDSDFGLPGGALWPLESRIFYDAIRATPQSSGGTIERIAIGPTGGDADLRAEFLDGTVAIVAEVRNGFVQRQRVEIIGRIGVLWHRAKHVVVYERTVNPSAQFAPEWDKNDDPGWARYRSRRPIVRKVSEFVELMEPVRKYPDLGSTDAQSCGFLDSVRFNSKTINVDSAWAVDVQGDNDVHGYALPLWNRGAALRRPQVYPEPDVAFVTIGEGKEDRPLVAQGCLDTDNLWFYSEPSPGGNPDAWNDVFGVDWGHVLPPSVIDTEMTPGGDSHDGPLGGRKAPVPRTMPGYRRFTWRLARADAKTAVNAAYGAKPVFVGLDSVTFSRRMPVAVPKTQFPPNTSESDLHKFRAQAFRVATAHSLLTQLEMAANSDDSATTTELLKKINDRKSVFVDDWKAIPSLEQTLKPIKCPNGTQQLQGQLEGVIAAKGRLLARSARDLIHDQVEVLTAASDEIVAIFRTQYQNNNNDALRWIRIALAKSPPLKTLIDDSLGIGIGDQAVDDTLVAEVEKTRAILHGALGSFLIALTDLNNRIDAVRSAFTSTEVWSRQRYEAFTSQVTDLLAAVPARLMADLDDAKHRFAAELGPLAVPAINQASTIFSAIDHLTDEVVASLSFLPPGESHRDCIEAVKNLLAAVGDQLDTIEKAGKSIDSEVETAFNAISRYTNSASVLRQKAGQILAEDVIANAIAEKVSGEVISALVASAKDEAALKINLPKLGAEIDKHADEIVRSILAAVDLEAIKGLKAISAASNDLATTMCETWTAFSVPMAAPWEKLSEAAKLLTEQADLSFVKTWIENNKSTIHAANSAWQSYSGVVSEKLMALRDQQEVRAGAGNALRLLSAATTAPEIGVLQGNVDRVRCSYEDAKVKLTKAKASLNGLGDALKAMGIDVPFDGIGDTLTLPEAELAKLDVTKLFPNFGGLDLKKLFGDVKLPPGVKDAVRITHDFDRKQLRAWVQVDVDVPVPGNRELYAIGPFALYFRDSKLTGRMRAEASQEDDAVRDTGSGEIATNIDVVVNGERLLALERVRISYSGSDGLKFDFDPQYIRLHPSMQFVQDTFGDLFADEIGGLTILKESGVPVGVEHLFSLPTISLMSGTTGIANIQLSNAFRLRAYPEFVIANRFNLSRVDAPFLFTFFILGGTGYTFVDTSYSPLTNKLVVTVEAAIGGAAAFGFAWGPVNGVVFITLSVAITYRKVIGGGESVGDGLAVSVILLIAGNVSLKGMVDISIAIMLRIIYREGGRIDGLGTLAVKVKISRLITIKYNAQITYKLCNGKSSTSVQSKTSTTLDEEQKRKLDRIQDYKDKLEKARS